ncbi:MAG: hypothetical protein V3W32_05835 [Gemmatimonadota bacterium]
MAERVAAAMSLEELLMPVPGIELSLSNVLTIGTTIVGVITTIAVLSWRIRGHADRVELVSKDVGVVGGKMDSLAKKIDDHIADEEERLRILTIHQRHLCVKVGVDEQELREAEFAAGRDFHATP